MKICVLGGDGYCGWATALYLSREGPQVAIADNFARRQWDYELGVQTLTPIRPMPERLRAWRQLTGETIEFLSGDITDYDFICVADAHVRAGCRGAFCRAAGRSLFDDRPQARGFYPGKQRGRHAQPAVRHARVPARMPPGETGHHGRVRHAQYRYRRGLSRRWSTTAARMCCRFPSSPALSITFPRCTTATTSCSPARSGGCAPPISTRAWCTEP